MLCQCHPSGAQLDVNNLLPNDACKEAQQEKPMMIAGTGVDSHPVLEQVHPSAPATAACSFLQLLSWCE